MKLSWNLIMADLVDFSKFQFLWVIWVWRVLWPTKIMDLIENPFPKAINFMSLWIYGEFFFSILFFTLNFVAILDNYFYWLGSVKTIAFKLRYRDFLWLQLEEMYVTLKMMFMIWLAFLLFADFLRPIWFIHTKS